MKSSDQEVLRELVSKRFEKSKGQIEKSIKMIEAGKPLDAEPDSNRKIARVAAVAHIPEERASELITSPGAESDLPPAVRRLAEAIQGETIDFEPISFVEGARRAANAVARVIGPETGTGFMISRQLFITNQHVVKTPEDARETLVEFFYEEDHQGQARQVSAYRLDPDKFFASSAINDLDYAIIAIGPLEVGPDRLVDIGYCFLSAASNKHTIGERANILQHPNGDPKQIVCRDNRILARPDNENVLLYEADTQGGASGSPVFNNQWQVIALHHWGGPHRARLDKMPDLPEEINEGIRVSSIVKDLKNRMLALEPAARILLEEALSPDHASAFLAGSPQLPGSEVAQPQHDPNTIFATESTQPNSTGRPMNEITLTIPIEVTIRIPNLEPSSTFTTKSAVPVPSSAESVRVDRNYENRNGYDPKFLTGIDVPLPRPLDDRHGLIAPLVEDEDEFKGELKYQNFSVLMNADRLMAYVTACNIDGKQAVALSRDGSRRSESLEASELDDAEASESWFNDPRIALQHQHGQDLYSKQRPRRLFDRGHLVRRLDPVWGPLAVRANADTFHFTNCSPQASPFNQGKTLWQGIENFVLNNAIAEGAKITVLTGPVFGDNDQPYRTVKVPEKFFKIIVRIDEGRPKVTAFLASQERYLDSLPEALQGRAESFDDTSKVGTYLSTVSEIQKLTQLDLALLAPYDTGVGQQESILKSADDLLRALA